MCRNHRNTLCSQRKDTLVNARLFLVGSALLLSTTLAHAQVYQCTTARGRVFQDRPCEGDDILLRAAPVSRRVSRCEALGAYAVLIAGARDLGISVEETLAFWTTNDDSSLKDDATEMRTIVLNVYKQHTWTPSIAQTQIEVACVQHATP